MTDAPITPRDPASASSMQSSGKTQAKSGELKKDPPTTKPSDSKPLTPQPSSDASSVPVVETARSGEDTAGYSADLSMHGSIHPAPTHHKPHPAIAVEAAAAEEDQKQTAREAAAKQHEQSHSQELFVTGDSKLSDDQVPVTSDGAAFVNVGLAQWEEVRKQWLEREEPSEQQEEVHAKSLDADEIIDIIFQTPKQWRENSIHGQPPSFPKPVPLPQIIDILLDLWEAEGLDM